MTFVRAKIPSREHCIGFMKQKWKYILQKKRKIKQKGKETDSETSKMLFIINQDPTSGLTKKRVIAIV